MKKNTTCVVVLCLFCTLTACKGLVITPSLPTSTPSIALTDFENKVLLGEDDNYSVYLINPTIGEDASQTGELIVNEKSTNQVIKMNGTFSIMGVTIVYDDGKGKYILLSVGTYTSRNGIVLSLGEAKQVVNTFCMTATSHGDHLFWNDYIIINNCDIFPNRPWGAGEAPSITAINLLTGVETVISKSDLTHQFEIKSIDGNNLQYIETRVQNETDWQNLDKQITEERTFDLSSLGQ